MLMTVVFRAVVNGMQPITITIVIGQ